MAMTLGTQVAFAGEVGEMQTDHEIQVLQTYIRIRDGVAPASDVKTMREALKRYRTSFQNVEESANIDWSSSSNCQRFKTLYNEIGAQLVQYYGQLLSLKPFSSVNTENIDGRLYTLKLFETALFSFALSGTEGGKSLLDPNEKSYCLAKNRNQWLVAMARAHQDLQVLHGTVFGFRSATEHKNSVDIVRQLNTRVERRKTIERDVFNVAELIASFWVWFKGAAPVIRWARSQVESPVLRFAISTAGFFVYMVSFMKFDKVAHAHLPFFQPPVELQAVSFSQWNGLISKGEEVVGSKLNSPQLYFAYLKLIALLDRETAYNFLIQHQTLLSQMENQYGSIDAALNHLKEERENETKINRAG